MKSFTNTFTRHTSRAHCHSAVRSNASTRQRAKTRRLDLPEQYEARYKTLINELRCLVCQNELWPIPMPSWRRSAPRDPRHAGRR